MPGDACTLRPASYTAAVSGLAHGGRAGPAMGHSQPGNPALALRRRAGPGRDRGQPRRPADYAPRRWRPRGRGELAARSEWPCARPAWSTDRPAASSSSPRRSACCAGSPGAAGARACAGRSRRGAAPGRRADRWPATCCVRGWISPTGRVVSGSSVRPGANWSWQAASRGEMPCAAADALDAERATGRRTGGRRADEQAVSRRHCSSPSERWRTT